MSSFDVRRIVTLGHADLTGRRIQSGQYLTAEAALRRLYGLDQPGVIVADEVGLGKTYVALGVAAWLLRTRPRSRVLVLTNSGSLVRTWAARWERAIEPRDQWTKPTMHALGGYEDYASMVKDPSRRLAAMSYESLKRFTTDWNQVRTDIGAWLFQPKHRPGVRLNADRLRALKRSLGIRVNARPHPLQHSIPASEARGWWREHYDPVAHELKDAAKAWDELQNLELRYQPSLGGAGRRFRWDLVIIDEAHRFDSRRRRDVVDLLLKDNVRKFLHVTATPFALSVDQLVRLLEMFGAGLPADARDAHERKVQILGLRDFERAVGLGEAAPNRKELERALRRWIVRRTWGEEAGGAQSMVKERRSQVWRVAPDASEGFLATLALERAIAELLREGSQTHIASRRTSLCSSWSSALASLEDAQFGAKSSSGERFRTVAVEALRPVATEDSPKVRIAAERIARLVRSGRKVLLFAEREVTLLSLQRQLQRLLFSEQQLARRQRERFLQWYRTGRLDRLKRKAGLYGGDAALKALLASLAGQTPGHAPDSRAVRRSAEAWLKASGANEERLGWLASSFEGGRTIRAVEVFDGSRGNSWTVNRFNLPGTPWVLLCSKKAQESIDLHVECNTVVLFDPVWNPAHREQRIGRVQRIGSRFRTIDVIDVITEGTYEEFTFHRAMSRARMMQVLLGAGRWLDEDLEISNPEAYRIDLSPRSRLEGELITEAGG